MSYAFIKMDPLAMVGNLGLDDSKTLAAVAKMKPKKYLIYLEYVSLSRRLLIFSLNITFLF